MPFEQFDITIAKTGEVIVKIDRFTERRVKYYREMLEDILGPAREITIVPVEEIPPGGVKISDKKKDDKLKIKKTET